MGRYLTEGIGVSEQGAHRSIEALLTVPLARVLARIAPGEAPCPDWLGRDWLISTFGSTEQAAVAAQRRFVTEGIGQPGPWEHLRHQVFLGSQTFVEHLRRKLPRYRDLSEVPRAQRRSLPKPLPDYARMHPDRDEATAAAYASGGYTLKAIGEYFERHYAQISRIVRRLQDAKSKT